METLLFDKLLKMYEEYDLKNYLTDEEKKQFIEFKTIKKTLKSQTEISDEEIRKQGIKYDNQALSETPIAHFIEGAKWYREQLKKK